MSPYFSPIVSACCGVEIVQTSKMCDCALCFVIQGIPADGASFVWRHNGQAVSSFLLSIILLTSMSFAYFSPSVLKTMPRLLRIGWQPPSWLSDSRANPIHTRCDPRSGLFCSWRFFVHSDFALQESEFQALLTESSKFAFSSLESLPSAIWLLSLSNNLVPNVQVHS